MKVATFDPANAEPTIRANKLEPGDVFRFAEDTFQDALQASTFWLRVASPDKDKDTRLFAVSIDGKSVRVFDADRLVVKHVATVYINPTA
ncbi:hypothetical protein A2765_01845 [Candidatus Kaiserbacteria bacterium RIFCSPHIGHO2_01_FULL_56_24]|uniref:Uncharacterized protein n=1 Tax=Candidatus Kaiserbacteria bacterium RIFCSPHIGHO2_01_FULL_56_24 TaxID=1798487 RepID=A0A1F6DHN0_9BACT|nr:MAG: hypothetical protein A2765_01845 [Candidatus Kaiserbacteria bacterium RIFCSPHIGHO2_01_FULL_56_24]